MRFIPLQTFTKMKTRKDRLNILKALKHDLRSAMTGHTNTSLITDIASVDKKNGSDVMRMRYGKLNQFQSGMKLKPPFNARLVASNIVTTKKRRSHLACASKRSDADDFSKATLEAGEPLACVVSDKTADALFGCNASEPKIGLLVRFPVNRKEQAICAHYVNTVPYSYVLGVPMHILHVGHVDFDGDTLKLTAVTGPNAIVSARELLSATRVPHSGSDFVEHPIPELQCMYHCLHGGNNIYDAMLAQYVECVIDKSRSLTEYSRWYRRLCGYLTRCLHVLNNVGDAFAVNVLHLFRPLCEELGIDATTGVIQRLIDSRCCRLNTSLLHQISVEVGDVVVDKGVTENLSYVNSSTAHDDHASTTQTDVVSFKSNMMGGYTIDEFLLAGQLGRGSIVSAKTEIARPGTNPSKIMLYAPSCVVSEIFTVEVDDVPELVTTHATKCVRWLRTPKGTLGKVLLNACMNADNIE